MFDLWPSCGTRNVGLLWKLRTLHGVVIYATAVMQHFDRKMLTTIIRHFLQWVSNTYGCTSLPIYRSLKFITFVFPEQNGIALMAKQTPKSFQVMFLLCMCCLIFSMRFYDWTKAIERIRCTYITSHCHKMINYSNKSTSGHLFVSQMMFWVIETEQNNKIIVIVRPKEMLNILNSKIVFSCFYKRIFPCNTQCRWLSTDFLGSSKSCQRSERMNNK